MEANGRSYEHATKKEGTYALLGVKKSSPLSGLFRSHRCLLSLLVGHADVQDFHEH